LFGCIAIPHGKKVDVAKAEGIVVGSTTKSEIVKTFGQPPIKQTSGGVDMWMYRHTLEWGTIATGTHGHDVTELVLTFRGDLVASCQITITKINRFSGGTKSIDSHPCGKTDLKGSPRHE
jgi:outer membrane protein assembly factor BamE (lipoprotein component of BamABCDE complex)